MSRIPPARFRSILQATDEALLGARTALGEGSSIPGGSTGEEGDERVEGDAGEIEAAFREFVRLLVGLAGTVEDAVERAQVRTAPFC